MARSQKEGPRRGCRGRLSKRRGPARASPCAEPAKPWRSSKTSQPKASFAPAAEWEGGGPARAPPSPPAVTGAITLLAADGYQLASASLSRFPSPRLPSPPVPNCWLHLSERGREARLRPAASGDVARLLARRAPPRSPGRGLRTAQCVPLAPQPRKGLSRSLEDPLSTRCKTLATALYPATLPPASAATLALQIPGAPRFSISLPPSSPCATQMPTGRLDHSEAFALLGLPLHAKRPCPLLLNRRPQTILNRKQKRQQNPKLFRNPRLQLKLKKPLNRKQQMCLRKLLKKSPPSVLNRLPSTMPIQA